MSCCWDFVLSDCTQTSLTESYIGSLTIELLPFKTTQKRVLASSWFSSLGWAKLGYVGSSGWLSDWCCFVWSLTQFSILPEMICLYVILHAFRLSTLQLATQLATINRNHFCVGEHRPRSRTGSETQAAPSYQTLSLPQMVIFESHLHF